SRAEPPAYELARWLGRERERDGERRDGPIRRGGSRDDLRRRAIRALRSPPPVRDDEGRAAVFARFIHAEALAARVVTVNAMNGSRRAPLDRSWNAIRGRGDESSATGVLRGDQRRQNRSESAAARCGLVWHDRWNVDVAMRSRAGLSSLVLVFAFSVTT